MSTLSSVNITILGSASAQPSSTRNHSALALRLDGDVWLFDCGEATQHQIQKSSVKIGKVQKIFVTHTHGRYPFSSRHARLGQTGILLFAGDHIFGLLPVLAMRLNGAGGTVDVEDPRATAAAPEDVPVSPRFSPIHHPSLNVLPRPHLSSP